MRKKIFFIIFLGITILTFSSQKTLSKFSKGENIPASVFQILHKNNINTKNKTLLLNFSATWCPSCIKEKNKFNKTYNNTYKKNKNLQVVVIFGPYGKEPSLDTISKVKKYMKDNNYNFPLYFDKDRVLLNSLGIKSLPTSLVISPKRKLLQVVNKYSNLKDL